MCKYVVNYRNTFAMSIKKSLKNKILLKSMLEGGAITAVILHYGCRVPVTPGLFKH